MTATHPAAADYSTAIGTARDILARRRPSTSHGASGSPMYGHAF